MKALQHCLLAGLILVAHQHPFCQTTIQRIDSLMNLFSEYTHFSGAVLVAEKGEVIYKKAFGMANMEWSVPNTTSTRFKLASLGKQFTAVLILQLAEEGKLELNAPITKYLADYPSHPGDSITIHQLLNHTSGIPNYHAIADQAENIARAYSREEYLDLIKPLPLLFTPGTNFQYSDPGYFLLGCIVERVSGVSFDRLIHAKILEPAGMTSTTSEDAELIIQNAASGYTNVYIGYAPAKYRHSSQVFGAGHIVSTVEDFFRYDQALQDGRLLSESSLKQMYTSYLEDYGYGWFVSDYPVSDGKTTRLARHDGGTFGFSSAAYRFIDDQTLIVAFSNISPYDINMVPRGIGRILYNREEVFPQKSLVEQFAITTHTLGIKAAVDEFIRLRANETELYELDGVAFNHLGYHYLRKGLLIEAIEVFKLNVEAFPGVGDPYDSLAEAYMIQGNSALAIEYYGKALALDPNNANAQVMLRKLKG